MPIKRLSPDEISASLKRSEASINNAAKTSVKKEKDSQKTVSMPTSANLMAARRKSFRDFVNSTHSYVEITNTTSSGDIVETKYLTCSAWQYLAALFELTYDIYVSTAVKTEDLTVIQCSVDLFDKDDNKVSHGVMVASSDEKWLSDKPINAVYGLAQTRAISRAIRNKYGWFAEYCGFSATPSEEISTEATNGK